LPPEINPLTAGGKDNPPTTGTAGLEGSIVNIVNPPSLPDPAGLAPLYGAIANGNMFRDMSGMAQTAALAQAALQAAQAGASDATSAAGQAQQVAATQLTEFLKLAAQVAMAAMGGGGAVGGLGAIGGIGGGGKPGVSNTPSNAGALINHGKSMDAASDHGRALSSNNTGSGGGGGDGSSDEDDPYVSPGGDDSGVSSGESDAFGVALNGGGTMASRINDAVAQMALGQTAKDVAKVVGKVIGGKSLEKGLDVITGEVTKSLGVGKGNLVLPSDTTIVLGGTSPDDYRPRSDYVTAARRCSIQLMDLGSDGPGSGLSGVIHLEWLIVQYMGVIEYPKAFSPATRRREEQAIRSVDFMKGITGHGSISVGGALDNVQIKVSIKSYNVDDKFEPRTLVVLALIDFALEPKTAFGSTVYGTVTARLHPSTPDNFQIKYRKAGPEFLVIEAVQPAPP
jgi:hypothetical protein